MSRSGQRQKQQLQQVQVVRRAFFSSCGVAKHCLPAGCLGSWVRLTAPACRLLQGARGPSAPPLALGCLSPGRDLTPPFQTQPQDGSTSSGIHFIPAPRAVSHPKAMGTVTGNGQWGRVPKGGCWAPLPPLNPLPTCKQRLTISIPTGGDTGMDLEPFLPITRDIKGVFWGEG